MAKRTKGPKWGPSPIASLYKEWKMFTKLMDILHPAPHQETKHEDLAGRKSGGIKPPHRGL